MNGPTTPRRIVLLLLSILVIFSLIVLLDLALDPTSIGTRTDQLPPMTVGWVFAGLVLFGLLLAAYWRGWDLTRHSAVIVMTLLIGFATPDPFVSEFGSVAVFLPPAVALVFTNSTWVILSAVSTITILIIRAGGQGIYTQPVVLSIIVEVVAGMALSRKLLGMAQQRAETQAAELAHQRDTLRFQAHLLDVVQQAVIATDPAGTITIWNRYAELLYGWSAAEAVGRNLAELISWTPAPNDGSAPPDAWSTADEGHEMQAKRRDGSTFLVWRTATPIYDDQHTLVGIVNVSMDITMRRQAEVALRASEQRYRRIVETAQEGIWILDGRATTSYVNRRMADMLGYTVDEMLNQPVSAFLDDAARRESLRNFARRAQGRPAQYDFRFRRKDGTAFWGLISTSSVMDGAGHFAGTLGMITDITERKRTEDALRESEELYRLIAEHTSDLISLLDEDGRFLYVSPSYEAVLGYNPVMLLGRTPFELLHPEDAATVPPEWQRPVAKGTIHALVRFLHADSSWRWFESSNTTFVREGVSYVASVARDVTEPKRLEAQLRQAQKMEAIGRLAGGVAHDFNNLLTAIAGYIELALLDSSMGSELRGDLSEIMKATMRAAGLTRQLLAFARKQIIDPHVFNLNDLVLDMDRLLRPLIGEDIELVTLPGSDLGHIKADPGQVEQILVNLAINARDAMPSGGKLTVETANIVLDDNFARGHVGVTPGPYVLLAVSDTGVGMSAEVQAHIFEPFFTTKEPGKGTGLGLATCYGIIKQHGGYIWVYSEVGQGTTFKIYFPRVVEPLDEMPRYPDERELPQGSETILLVEDEPSVRALAVRVLRARGYAVLEAGNGAEALRVAQDYKGAIDLLLTDIVMPQMGGMALAEQLATLRPHVAIVYMSGYTDNTVVGYGRFEKGITFLQKPFSPGALARKVREVLD